MSTQLEEEFELSSKPVETIAHDGNEAFSMEVVFLNTSTQKIEGFTVSKEIVSLGLEENESIEEADKDIDQLTKNIMSDSPN